jgi:hypothetical protein
MYFATLKNTAKVKNNDILAEILIFTTWKHHLQNVSGHNV